MSGLPATWPVALAGLAFALLLGVCTWLASLWRHDASVADRVWSLFIAGAAAVYFVLLPAGGGRGRAMLVLVLAWAVRLAVFIAWRNWGHGEDRRYQAMRARNQPNFALKSLWLVFALQAVIGWIVSAPFLAGMGTTRPFGALDGIGIALTSFGIAFEAIADSQLARFKADPTQRGRVMDRGLWRFSRHPNYFGEACVWWGLWLLALGGAGWGGAWTVISPLVMTVLLLKVSGVVLLEKDMAERRPAYRDYAARTNAFVPGPVKRERA